MSSMNHVAVLRTLPLFTDVAPGVVVPRPRIALVKPSVQPVQLPLFELPQRVRRVAPPSLVLPGQLALFPDVVRHAPTPRARLRLVQGGNGSQLLLPDGDLVVRPAGKRHLMLVPEPLIDLYFESRGECLRQEHGCPFTSCRHHLNASEEFYERTWDCSITLAGEARVKQAKGGLAPIDAARADGLTEGEAQSAEQKAIHKLRRLYKRNKSPELLYLFALWRSSDPDGACL